jgi:hypothetical protein
VPTDDHLIRCMVISDKSVRLRRRIVQFTGKMGQRTFWIRGLWGTFLGFTVYRRRIIWY